MKPEKVINHIVDWLSNYTTTSHTKGFVIGISGGIDSAVTSTLCAKTSLPVLCLEMPIHQNPKEVDRSQKHIAFLKTSYKNVTSRKIDLSQTFDELCKLTMWRKKKIIF